MGVGDLEPVTYVCDARTPTTLPEVLERRAGQTPDARFVTFDGTHRTFAEMLQAAEQAAAALASMGVVRGDKVALMLPNSLEFLDLWFGSALLGAVLVPVNTALKGEGLRYIVEHSEAAVAAVDAPLLADFTAALPPEVGPQLRLARGATGETEGYGDLGALLAASHPAPARPTLGPGDLASVLYTSGTTGLPKGVLNCHNAYPTAGLEFAQRFVEARADDVFYTSLPLFHVNAQMLTVVGSLMSGRPMVLSPRFSASRFFDDLSAHGATVFNYIGAMLTMLAKQPPRPDDARNTARLTVGGAAPAQLWPEFERRFGLTILEIYGLTETATFCLGSPPRDIRVGKLGLPVSWAEVEVRRTDGTVAGPGEPGEIAIRSTRADTLFKGYFKNEEATTKAMTDGWFHSGDRGRRDEDGYFVFLDRLKDAIRRRGENISSYEVERVLNSHPDVVESAVVGVPSDLGEEDVMAIIVPRDAERFHPVGLTTYCADRMAAFMVPRYIRLREHLPKTATERVQKFALREDGIGDAWDRLAHIRHERARGEHEIVS